MDSPTVQEAGGKEEMAKGDSRPIEMLMHSSRAHYLENPHLLWTALKFYVVRI